MKNDPYGKNQEIITAYINMLTENLNYGLLLISSGGLGKTTITLETLEKKGLKRDQHFLYANSFATPLAFYELLEKTTHLQNPQLLVLDDIELILVSKPILGMLRAALWEAGNKRIVNYHSTSKKVKNKEIDFTGKIILILNELPQENKIISALCDRLFFHNLQLTNPEIIQIMKTKIVYKSYKNLSLKQRIKIAEAVEERTTEKTKLSFRTLIKAYQFYLYAPNQWTQMLDSAMGIKEKPQQGKVDKKEERNVNTNTLI